MATNDISLKVSDNTERVSLRVSDGRSVRSITPDSGSPYYVGARAYVTQTENGAVVTVIDKDGTTTATILNGADGEDGYTPIKGVDYFDGEDGQDGQDGQDGADGQDGYTPIKGVDYFDGRDGTDGQDGQDGADGFSPIATVTKSGDTATISITDKNGTTTATVSDGTDGTDGRDVFYGTCDTAAATAAKVVDCSDFTADDLKAGAMLLVHFDATNSGAVASLSLNVNNTGAKNVKYINNGTLGNLTSAGYLKANTTYLFVYDGTYWVVYLNYNTTYSSMTDAEYQAGTSTTARTITPARLKAAIQYHETPVSITRYTTSGTNIADLTIGDTTTKLYAPTGGGGGGITDVTVDGTSVVQGTVAAIDLTGKSDIGHTHTKSDITDFPTLATVATSGDYNDLTNKPTIPTVPTNVSAFTNDAGYLTSYTETDPIFSASAASGITSSDITTWNGKSDFSGDYDDLTNKPTLPSVYVTEEDELSGWHYRKWSTGKVEAWASLSFASATPSTWVSPIRYMDKTFTIPSGIFESAPLVIALSQSNQYWVVDANASSATSGNMRIGTVASSAMATYVTVYAWTN